MPDDPSLALHLIESRFLLALPRIQAHARIAFRFVRCPNHRDECVAEASALAWHWYRRLCERGKDPSGFITALAIFAARQVRCGRRLCGQEASKDAISALAQQRHRFAAQPILDESCPSMEALRNNSRTPVPVQAAFRLDFPRWLASLGDRHRRIAEDLMAGEQTKDVAAKYGLTPGRISQIRNELRRDWHRFHGEWCPIT